MYDIDKTKNLIARINDRHIFPHARVQYMMRSVDANAERFVLAVNVIQADSILRYREGDFNETVYVKGDGNTPPASPKEIIALYKRKFGVDNEPYLRKHKRQGKGLGGSTYDAPGFPHLIIQYREVEISYRDLILTPFRSDIHSRGKRSHIYRYALREYHGRGDRHRSVCPQSA